MNEHALRVLELDAALGRVAGRASSALGKERVRSLEPRFDRDALLAELEAVDQTRRFLDQAPQWAPPPIPDARAALQRLAMDGSVLDPDQLYGIGVLLRAGRLVRGPLNEARERAPLLWGRCSALYADPDREQAIERAVDAQGQVLDTASRELRRIRGELTRAHGRIVRALEDFLRTLPERLVVADGSVTIRNGRYVVPVRREGKKDVGGIVHDASATGATLFVEPPLAVQLMNDLKELERAEGQEIHRILTEHTRALRPHAGLLAASLEALAVFDSLYARARTATDWRGTAPGLSNSPADGLAIVEGRHPLLLSRTQDDAEVVPFDLTMEPGERVLVVSGPNTGGKTVFLKAIGLISALTQCGVIPPVGKGTRLPVFGSFYADIGDEQSIAESLSTFSAHLANLREVVETADARSLVLIDEMGTGTDPAEGAALARSILESLVERRSLAVVTSHLGALKRLDDDDSGIVNASLEFDPDGMVPTYVLVKGRPGRSYGLAIARRLGFPPRLLDRAQSFLSDDDARLDELLERLQRTEAESRVLQDSLAAEEARARRLAGDLESRERDLAHREKTAERRAKEEARKLLLEARAEVEEAIAQVRAGADDGEDAERAARRRVEEAAERHRRASADREADAPVPAGPVSVGDRVRIRSSGTRGDVMEVRDDRAVVHASGLRLQVPLAELERVAEAAVARPRSRPTPSVDHAWTAPDPVDAAEADLRGLRVDEVQLELERALDAAVLAARPEVRLIHGKGTGAVRQRVQELLKVEPRVGSFRLGGPGEGGTGVTVVTLR